MAKLVKKKKKKLGLGRVSAAPDGRETSPYRPKFVPKAPPCVDACPNANDIRKVLRTIADTEGYERSYDESFREAWGLVTARNPLPATCGRVCPHACESACNRTEVDGAVSINAIERFIGDYGINHGLELARVSDETRDEKVAIVGSGPAALSCAYQLASRGYSVTIFEAFSKPGGMLRYGIPRYRLPAEILDTEIQKILDLGVSLRCNTTVGADVPYEDLKRDFQAVFVAIGAHRGLKLRVDGEDASNVFSGTQFLNKVNSGETVDLGDKVIVIGGGDTAIDAARVARRLGANTTILYRRTIDEMPAIDEEIEGAKEEGVTIEFLAAPVKIHRANGEATGMSCIRMELGEPDASGRRRPVPIEGSEFDVEATAIIAAISQEPDFTGLEMLRMAPDWIKVDETGQTADSGTFAGGDVLDLGLATTAISQGRMAAESIVRGLTGESSGIVETLPIVKHTEMNLTYYEKAPRHEPADIPVEQRLSDGEAEVRQSLTEEDVIAEAKRCMSCGQCYDCGNCWSYCQDQAVVKPLVKGEAYKLKLEVCQGCKKCAEECPCGYVELFLP